MIEIVIAAGITGFLAAVAGNIVGMSVQRNENSHTTRRLNDHEIALALHTVQIQDIQARKHCGPCNEQDELRTKLADERHAEMLERFKSVDRTVQKCFKDFIEELRKP